MRGRRAQQPDTRKSRARAPRSGSQQTRWGAEPQKRVLTGTRESVLMRVGQAQSTRGLDQARLAYGEGLVAQQQGHRATQCMCTKTSVQARAPKVLLRPLHTFVYVHAECAHVAYFSQKCPRVAGTLQSGPHTHAPDAANIRSSSCPKDPCAAAAVATVLPKAIKPYKELQKCQKPLANFGSEDT